MAKSWNYRATGGAGGALAVFMLLFWLAGIGGWIANIVKIFWSAGEPLTAIFIIRCVGVFAAPVGAILGYL